MKRILLPLLLCAISLSEAQEIQNYKFPVGQFDKIRVLDNVNVVYRCNPDSSGFVQYRGRKEFADAFVLTPKKGELKIQVSTEDVGDPDLPILYVYSDFLISAENSSEFTLRIENPAPCAEFTTRQIGNGRIEAEGLKANEVNATIATGKGVIVLQGSTRDAQLKMVGAGTIQADRLESTDVTCKILGTGTIGCWPLQKLTTQGIGSTKIYYKGDPYIKKSGGGKLFPLPEDWKPEAANE